MLQSMGSQTVRHDLVTEQQQSSELINEHVNEDRRPRQGEGPDLPFLRSDEAYMDGLDDTIQPSHPLSSPSSPAFNLSQHQVLFQ